jgi:hypothetical protein
MSQIRLTIGDPGDLRGQNTHSTWTYALDQPFAAHLPSPHAQLELGELLAAGEVWDVFAGTLGSRPVVAKICGVADYHPLPQARRERGITAERVRACIAHEVGLYAEGRAYVGVYMGKAARFYEAGGDCDDSEVVVWCVVLEEGEEMEPWPE